MADGRSVLENISDQSVCCHSVWFKLLFSSFVPLFLSVCERVVALPTQ